MNNALATADFRLTGQDYFGDPVDMTVHAELHESGAFQYGNGTCMIFKWSNGRLEQFDTRYSRVSEETFTEFAYEVLRDRTFEKINIQVV